MSDSKICRNVLPCQQIKNFFSSLYQTLSSAVFATNIFVTKIMCCCVMHDATSSILLNSTNEANTFLTMYNIIKFLRLSILVWSTLNLNFPATANFKRSAEELLCAEGRRSKNDQRLWVHCEVQLQTLLYVMSINRIYHFIVFLTLNH